MRNLALVVFALVLSAEYATAQSHFDWTPSGQSSPTRQWSLDGFNGQSGSSGSGVEQSPQGGTPTWDVTWRVLENGDVEITCGECGEKSVLSEGATKESGSGSRNHNFGDETGSWFNKDFI
jgi:hypothetical protein